MLALVDSEVSEDVTLMSVEEDPSVVDCEAVFVGGAPKAILSLKAACSGFIEVIVEAGINVVTVNELVQEWRSASTIVTLMKVLSWPS